MAQPASDPPFSAWLRGLPGDCGCPRCSRCRQVTRGAQGSDHRTSRISKGFGKNPFDREYAWSLAFLGTGDKLNSQLQRVESIRGML